MQSVKAFARRLSVTAPTLLATAKFATGPFSRVPFRTYGFFFDRGNSAKGVARVQQVGDEANPKFDPSKPFMLVPFPHGFSIDDAGKGKGAIPGFWPARSHEENYVLHDGDNRFVAEQWPQTLSPSVRMNTWDGKYSVTGVLQLAAFVREGGVYLHFGGLGSKGEAVREAFAQSWAATHGFDHLNGPNCYHYLRDEMLHMVEGGWIQSDHLSKDELVRSLQSLDLKGITIEALAREFNALGLSVQGEGTDPAYITPALQARDGTLPGIVMPQMPAAERAAALDKVMPRKPGEAAKEPELYKGFVSSSDGHV